MFNTSDPPFYVYLGLKEGLGYKSEKIESSSYEKVIENIRSKITPIKFVPTTDDDSNLFLKRGQYPK